MSSVSPSISPSEPSSPDAPRRAGGLLRVRSFWVALALAMRQRPPRASHSLWERVVAGVARRFGVELPAAADEQTMQHIPEPALVALAALQQFEPRLLKDEALFQQRLVRNIAPVATEQDSWSLLQQAKEAHAQRFGRSSTDSLDNYRTAFLKMSADIRVN
jgi:hypothetical protein